MKRIATVFLFLALSATPALAQDTTLDRVHNLIAAGRFTEANNVLAQWDRAHANAGSDATSADRARALYLHGVLSTDAKQAEEAFLGVVLSYPSSAVAPQALLRLGQGLVTTGEPRRAVAYLERLRSDYPGARERAAGLLWLARAQHGVGAPAAACSAAREAAASDDPNIRTLAEIERDRACPQTGNAVRSDSTRTTTPPANTGAPPANTPRPQPVNPPVTQPLPQPATPPKSEPATRGDYAVQTGAFSVRASADGIAGQLRTKGFDARVVQVEGSALHRVRVGSFATNADATRIAQRIRDAGFTAIVVNDVKKERAR